MVWRVWRIWIARPFVPVHSSTKLHMRLSFQDGMEPGSNPILCFSEQIVNYVVQKANSYSRNLTLFILVSAMALHRFNIKSTMVIKALDNKLGNKDIIRSTRDF